MRAFHWWLSGNKKRTQNVSELYSLYAWFSLSLCIVSIQEGKDMGYLMMT